jgi:RNA polymerase sigma-70 factor (ECF subfamily)
MESSRTAARLFECYHLTVYRYFLRMTGRKDLAQDLTQDVFLRVVRAIDTYADRGRELSWIFQIARNLLRDRHREAGRRPEHVSLTDAGDLAVQNSTDVALAVDRAMSQLGELDREVFLLLDTGGLSYDEIAKVTGLSVAGVRSRLHRARRSLAASLSLAPAKPHRLVSCRRDGK